MNFMQFIVVFVCVEDPFSLLSFFPSSAMAILENTILVLNEKPNLDPTPAPLLKQLPFDTMEVAIILFLL